MLSKDTLEIVLNPGPGFYSHLFLVEKVTGGWCPVIDLSHRNVFVRLTPFKMETVALVLLSVREGDFLASIDLKDVYFQISIHQSLRKLMWFQLEGTVYQFKALCFGLSTAPQVFTRVFVVVSTWAHTRGIRLLSYLDDWLVLASSEAGARQHVRDLLSLCHSLGIVINEKSNLVPLQTANYLGMTIDTRAARIFPSLSRVEKFLSVAEMFCAMSAPPAQLWQVVLGHMASLEKLVPHSRLQMRSLQWHLKTLWSPKSDPPSLPVPLSREDLSWWMVRDHLLKRVRFGTPAPDLHLYSDASRLGWGTHLLDWVVSGLWSDQERLLHINFLKMKALFLALQSFQELVAGRRVTVMCDNSTAVAYVNKQRGTVYRSLCSLASWLLRWTESLEVHLDARYLPGQSSVLADLLSHRDQVIGTEVARDLFRRWSSPSVDLIATSLNAKLPLCCSLVPDPQAVFEDAFRHPCNDLHLYAFPPFPLVGRVVARVRETPNLSMTPAAALQPVPQRRPCTEPSHVVTLQRLLQKLGFSQGAAVEMSGCIRTSTSRLYQAKWLLFCGWCRGRSVDFLIHFRRDKGLSVSAVKGYHAALNSVFALKGMNLVDSRPISMLIRNFSKSARPQELRPPAWNVTLVLQSLTRAPYEPLRTSDERFLAQKTLFLLTLASAKRIGELHALSHRVSHSRDLGEISFTFVVGFVAKTQDPSSSVPLFEGFTVPALPNSSTNRNRRLLCPVLAVRCYLAHTAAHRPRCERLFVTAGRSTKEISKNTSLLLAPEDSISGVPSLREVRSGPSSEGTGDPWYLSACYV